MSAWTTSRARTFVDGFAGLPLTRTCPPSHSWVAMGRVLTSRTAHNQRSIRVSSAMGVSCRRAFRSSGPDVGRSWHDVENDLARGMASGTELEGFTRASERKHLGDDRLELASVDEGGDLLQLCAVALDDEIDGANAVLL